MERDDRICRREKPSMILPGAQSVIMVGMHYWPGKSGFPSLHAANKHTGVQKDDPRGIISSYAWGEDYHKILSRRLKLLGRHLNRVAGGVGRFYVDTGAILERDFAERAGLGFVGKNSLVINPRSGSGFFIGELFSTVKLEYDGDTDYGTEKRGGAGCGGCEKCRVACPTGAIVDDYVVDARRCISYLTIEQKGSIPEGLRRGIGGRVYGCDICQMVCPWNRYEWGGAGEGFSPLFGKVERAVTSPRLRELARLTEDGFEERFGGSAVRRIGRERMVRNAVVGLGNVGGAGDLEVLREAVGEGGVVGEHARWAIGEIESREGEGEGGGKGRDGDGEGRDGDREGRDGEGEGRDGDGEGDT